MNHRLKRGIACLLGCTMLFTSNFSIGNHTKEVQAASKEDIRLQGIDVSHHQKKIDWAKVKASGIDYAIIRCGYGQDVTLQDDIQWKANADGCTAQKIPFGVYLYSYATTVEGAEGEADHVLRMIEGYDLQYPVYYDIEESKQKDLGAKKLGEIASAFAKKIEDAGYQVGIYASYSWFQNYLTDPVFDQWERWVARYNTYCGYNKPYSMWQYSSSGTVSGIDSSIKVDMDYVIGTDVITKVNEISCSQPKLELKVGENVSLSAEVSPKNALNKNITWTSSDKNVATVSQQGEIKAVGEGKVKIVAASVENTSITASCNITVTSSVKPTETPKPTTKVTETPKPTAKPTETPKPTTKVTETPKPTTKVTETPKPTT
ncbi:MAG: Ig-like domain-containing protein, partial [Lachnospiraceae bacterium]|nr:Ig-like domain-containing protein [Lachnospiraceae bacterium]